MDPTNQYQDVFQRYEQKYLLQEKQYRIIRRELQNRIVPDQYGKSTICNIYFDTPDFRIVRSSLAKPVYKEKLRLRSYGVPGMKNTVFVELKKKYKGIVYKRRADMSLEEAVQYLYRGGRAPKSSQILKEIDWVRSYYPGIRPAMALFYDRVALYGAEDPSLRITFDSNILWRTESLALNRGVWGTPLLAPGQYLMELKTPGAVPLWVAHILDRAQVYPCSFSKYGRAYQNSCCGKIVKKGVEECA